MLCSPGEKAACVRLADLQRVKKDYYILPRIHRDKGLAAVALTLYTLNTL